MLADITISREYNKDGGFECLVIRQSDNVIKVSGHNGMDGLRSWHWKCLQKQINNHFDSIRNEEPANLAKEQ